MFVRIRQILLIKYGSHGLNLLRLVETYDPIQQTWIISVRYTTANIHYKYLYIY